MHMKAGISGQNENALLIPAKNTSRARDVRKLHRNRAADRTGIMTDKEENEERETVSIGPLSASLSKENMRAIMPYVGISLIVLTVAMAIASIMWGSK